MGSHLKEGAALYFSAFHGGFPGVDEGRRFSSRSGPRILCSWVCVVEGRAGWESVRLLPSGAQFSHLRTGGWPAELYAFPNTLLSLKWEIGRIHRCQEKSVTRKINSEKDPGPRPGESVTGRGSGVERRSGSFPVFCKRFQFTRKIHVSEAGGKEAKVHLHEPGSNGGILGRIRARFSASLDHTLFRGGGWHSSLPLRGDAHLSLPAAPSPGLWLKGEAGGQGRDAGAG